MQEIDIKKKQSIIVELCSTLSSAIAHKSYFFFLFFYYKYVILNWYVRLKIIIKKKSSFLTFPGNYLCFFFIKNIYNVLGFFFFEKMVVRGVMLFISIEWICDIKCSPNFVFMDIMNIKQLDEPFFFFFLKQTIENLMNIKQK